MRKSPPWQARGMAHLTALRKPYSGARDFITNDAFRRLVFCSLAKQCMGNCVDDSFVAVLDDQYVFRVPSRLNALDAMVRTDRCTASRPISARPGSSSVACRTLGDTDAAARASFRVQSIDQPEKVPCTRRARLAGCATRQPTGKRGTGADLASTAPSVPEGRAAVRTRTRARMPCEP